MWFKKKEGVAPAWWQELDERQKRYAQRFADYLGRKAVRVPGRRLRVYVVVALLLMVTVQGVTTFHSLHRGPSVQVPFGWPEQLVIPAPGLPGTPEGFRVYLDSLRRDSVMGPMIDSLLRARPGLADTIRMLEGMR